jgi:macrolide transport system ATP-binding/permease protein
MMGYLRAALIRLRGLLNQQDGIDAELAAHLELHTEDNVRAGMAPEEARRQALIKLGGIDQTRQAWRDRSTVPWIESLLQDTRFATRQLRQNPGFAIIAVLVLSLGIAASTAIFSFVDAALIKPLPYLNPNRLVAVTEQIALIGRANISYPDFVDWKRMNTAFQSFSVFTGNGSLLTTDNGAVMVPGARVSDTFFRTLGIRPILGRDFYPGEDAPHGPNNVIITYASWQKRFGGRRDIIGHAVTLSGLTSTIVGVLPQDFQFAPRGHAEFWYPLQAAGECAERRSCHNLDGIARLKDGVSVAAALAQMQAIAAQLEQRFPGDNRGQGASVEPLSELIVGDIRPILETLLAGAGLLLMIACTNVASLLLVRSEGRRREFAVRGALGASRFRLVRQFVTEAALIVAAAVAIGLSTAYGLMKLLTHLVPEDMLAGMPFLRGLSINAHAVLFAAAIALFSLALFSLTPIFRIPSTQLRDGLAEGARSSTGVAWRRLGAHFVVVELAIAVVLLVGAGLLGKSFYRLLRVDLNFQPDHLATLSIALNEQTYTNGDQLAAVTRRILEHIQAVPGVQSVAITSLLPVTTNGNTDWIRFVGRPYDGKHIEVPEREVSADYFSTLRTRLLRGRFFTNEDTAKKPLVAIINNSLARKYFPGQDPIGQQFGGPALDPKSIKQIVGVVDDLKEGPLDSEIVPTVYYPLAQNTDSYYSVVVRTTQSEESTLPTLVEVVRQVDKGIGVSDETSMDTRIHDSQTAYLHRSSARIVAGFAALALLLSVVGLYGVIAYSVSQREREIGIRMALGAQRSSVYRLVLSEAGKLALWGVAAGVFGSLASATLLRSLLFGVRTWDVGVLCAVSALLAASALLASYLPARRAASIQPVIALRAE